MSIPAKQIADLNERIAAMRKLLDEAEVWNGEGDTWSAVQALEDIIPKIHDARQWFYGDIKKKVTTAKSFHMLRTLEDAFVYFLDCQLATVEGLQILARPPKSRLARYRGIARKMIDQANAHMLDVSEMERVIGFEASTQEESKVE